MEAKSRPEAVLPQLDDEPVSSNNSSLPFHINDFHDQQRRIRTFETVPAGYFSKSSRFSKIGRNCATFESETVSGNACSFDGGEDSTLASQKASCVREGDNGSVGIVDVAASNIGSLSNCLSSRKRLDLIGGHTPLPPVKFPRTTGSEGNFVKLDMNRKRKFLSRKGKNRTSYASTRRRHCKRQTRSRNVEDDGKMENELSADDLVTEASKCWLSPGELIEEAVSRVQEESSNENLVRLLNTVYGHDSFRDGQVEAIKMVLQGKSTMLVLPTGAGKSLCYQIPAMIFSGITLVVCPLVALMIDQVKQLPPVISGGLLCSSQTSQEVADTFRMLRQGAIKVLFVSPERLFSVEFLSNISSVAVSLLVVDEAHCISEWSHNFRPSYMRLKASLLRMNLTVNCILGMTATATITTLNAVMSDLEIPSANLIQKFQLRDNLHFSASVSENRMKDLLALIKSSPFMEVQSIIIYCKFQSETCMISKYLCDNNISAKAYHSGIPSMVRSRIQDMFCSNKTRVVVATVAFGMGLDKKDVGAVIHYNMPESLEEYVQETGRAGRDGRLSYCHIFLDDLTYFKLRSLMHSDGVDEHTISKFLHQVFPNGTMANGRTCSIVKESATHKFDMKEEVMLTLLTQLELGEVQYLRLLPQHSVTCSLHFYKTSPFLLADKDLFISAIVKHSETKNGQYVFDILAVANSIGVTMVELSNHLQNLKFQGEITYELKDVAYCYTILQVPGDFCSLSMALTNWLSEVEHCKVRKLDAMYHVVTSAMTTCDHSQGYHTITYTSCLQRDILSYFTTNGDGCTIPNKIGESSSYLRADIKVFLQSNSHSRFTPRAIARIMHGIGSPAYPSSTWSQTHFWGRYIRIDFHVLLHVAKEELVTFVGKQNAAI